MRATNKFLCTPVIQSTKKQTQSLRAHDQQATGLSFMRKPATGGKGCYHARVLITGRVTELGSYLSMAKADLCSLFPIGKLPDLLGQISYLGDFCFHHGCRQAQKTTSLNNVNGDMKESKNQLLLVCLAPPNPPWPVLPTSCHSTRWKAGCGALSSF